MTDIIKGLIDLIDHGGQPAIVATVCSVGLIGWAIARQLSHLAPLVAAVRGHPVPPSPPPPPPAATDDGHDGESDYDTPLGALQMVAAGSHQPCIAIGEDGRVAVFNRPAEALTGYTTEEMLGSPLALLMAPTDARAHPHHVTGYLVDHAAGKRHRLMGDSREVTLSRRDGTQVRVRVDISHINNGWKGFWAWLGAIEA